MMNVAYTTSLFWLNNFGGNFMNAWDHYLHGMRTLSQVTFFLLVQHDGQEWNGKLF
jgi:hypothetical protein